MINRNSLSLNKKNNLIHILSHKQEPTFSIYQVEMKAKLLSIDTCQFFTATSLYFFDIYKGVWLKLEKAFRKLFNPSCTFPFIGVSKSVLRFHRNFKRVK